MGFRYPGKGRLENEKIQEWFNKSPYIAKLQHIFLESRN